MDNEALLEEVWSKAYGGQLDDLNGSLSLSPGDTADSIQILVVGDGAPEKDERFAVDVTSASHADVADGHAVGTIQDNGDRLPTTTAVKVHKRRARISVRGWQSDTRRPTYGRDAVKEEGWSVRQGGEQAPGVGERDRYQQRWRTRQQIQDALSVSHVGRGGAERPLLGRPRSSCQSGSSHFQLLASGVADDWLHGLFHSSGPGRVGTSASSLS